MKGRFCYRFVMPQALLMVVFLASACSSTSGNGSGNEDGGAKGWQRMSMYVPLTDAVKAAVDVYLPTLNGVAETGPLPAVFHYTRYMRAWMDQGKVTTMVDTTPALKTLLRNGYAVVVADARGTGASYGTKAGPLSETEKWDAYELIEWIAQQPWCDGHVGMHGRSYAGIMQYLVAAADPPHLDAIFPEMAGPILFEFIYQGGTYKEDFITNWGALTRLLDRSPAQVPVDEDTDGSMMLEALAQHDDNIWVDGFIDQALWRDWATTFPRGVHWSWDTSSAINYVDEIKASGVAIYHLAAWYDMYTTQQTTLFGNLMGIPQKMIIVPWTHVEGHDSDVLLTEPRRWYDYWLKGIDNGIMDEPPITYYVMEENNTLDSKAADLGETTRRGATDLRGSYSGSRRMQAQEWPLPDLDRVRFYLGEGPSGTVSSVNDGVLNDSFQPGSLGNDSYAVDYTTTSGAVSTRWKNGYAGARPDGTSTFDERTPEDEKGLTYTSPPLDVSMEVTGYPVVHLWVSSSAQDGDFFAYLEEVDATGRSHYVTEGSIRASYRRQAVCPWDNYGLPWHRGLETDAEALVPGQPVELVFDLLATSCVFDAGHRIRLTVVCADRDNFALYPDPLGLGAPAVKIYRNVFRASYLELPVVDANASP